MLQKGDYIDEITIIFCLIYYQFHNKITDGNEDSNHYGLFVVSNSSSYNNKQVLILFLNFKFIHGYYILILTNEYKVCENLGHFGKI